MQRIAVLTPAEAGGFAALKAETGTTSRMVLQGETIEAATPQAAQGHPLVTVFSVPEPLHA